MLRLARILVLAGMIAVLSAFPASGNARVFFNMDDPTGDDYGPGTYQYPKNEAFAPFSGLFDLTHFRVWSDPAEGDDIFFDVTFGAMSNPWLAPEGFIHQVINIYIDTRPGGRIETFKPGALVRFPSDQGWEIFIRGVGWESSVCYFMDRSGMIVRAPVEAKLEGDGLTVRLRVSKRDIGEPDESWGYYVLIGSYDGFGADNYRAVGKTSTEWNFGGGVDQDLNTNVIDLLAHRGGARRQEKQLSGFNPEAGTYAVIYPVGRGSGGFLPTFGWAAGLLALIGGLGYLANQTGLRRKIPRVFSWKVGGSGKRK